MQKERGNRGSTIVNKKTVLLEDLLPIVKILLDFVSGLFVQKNVGYATSIAFVEAEQPLPIKTLNALGVSEINRRPVGLIQTNLARSQN